MRGNAKSLKPMLTPTVERALEAVELAEAGALVLWFARQYRIMLDVLEEVYDKAKTPKDVAIALDEADEPPRPPVSPTAAAYFTILRGEAQDLVESNITGKLAERERKRKKRAEKARASGLSADNADNADNRLSSSPLESSLSESNQSVSQSTRAGARTNGRTVFAGRPGVAFSIDDYRRAAERAGFMPAEIKRFLELNERGRLSPDEAVRRFQVLRTPTEQAGGATAVSERLRARTFALAQAAARHEAFAVEQRRRDFARALIDEAKMQGVSITSHQDLRTFAIAAFPDGFVGDVDAVSEEVIAALAAPAATHGGAVGVGVSTPDGVEEGGGIPPPPGGSCRRGTRVRVAHDGAGRSARLTKGAAAAAPDVERENDGKWTERANEST